MKKTANQPKIEKPKANIFQITPEELKAVHGGKGCVASGTNRD